MESRLQRIERESQEDDQSILLISRFHQTTLNWLYDNGLLHRNLTCPGQLCNQNQLSIIQDLHTADRQKFRCKICKTSKSLRWKSFFSDHKLTLMECIQIIFYHFIRNQSLKQVSNDMKISLTAVGRLYAEVRAIISQFIEDFKIGRQLGIESTDPLNHLPIVEIDETLMTHHNGGQMWVLRIFDRVTKELWCWALPDRRAETLIPIIVSNAGACCRIYTDGWESYSDLAEAGFDHRVVLHVDGFGSGQETTNGIESCWSELKRLTNHSKGIHVSNEDPLGILQQFVNVGCWRRNFKDQDLCSNLREIISLYYSS